MPTRRMIDPSFWQSESLAKIAREDRFFFVGLISNADDQGRLRAHPAILRSEIYPFDDVDFAEIERQINCLVDIGCIHHYELDDGKQIIQIVNWWQYQSPQWAYPSKLPPPNGWFDRLRYREDNKVKTENWNGAAGFVGRDSDDGYTNLGKGEGNVLPKAQGKAIEIELESEIDNTTTTAPACARIPEQDLSPIPDTEFAKVCKHWENNMSLLSPVISDVLRDYTIRCPPEWVIKAIDEGVVNGVRKMSYVKTVLDSWIEAGKITDKPKQSKGHRNGQYSNKPNAPPPAIQLSDAAKVKAKRLADEERARKASGP